MSYITFGANDTVYVKGIGYATLLNCGARNTLSQKIQSLPQKKQSLIFDPDLFNPDGDSNNSKKQPKQQQQKIQKKETQPIKQNHTEQKPQKMQKQKEESINIIKAKLQGTNAIIYTSDKNVSKSITVMIKSLLINHRDNIVLDIEINRNIDTLKKNIFNFFGENPNYYTNVRIYCLVPNMTELTVTSKTIIQAQIKDMDKLLIVGDYAFGFRNIKESTGKAKYQVKLGNNVTLTSSKPVEEPKKVDQKAVIALPPPPQSKQTKQQKKVDEKKQQQKESKPQQKQQKQEAKSEQPKGEVTQQKKSSTQQSKIDQGPYCAKCAIQFNSGRRYWQIKIQKLPTDQQDLFIGVCVDSDQKDAENNCWGCDYAWGYQPISGKKVYYARDWESQLFQEESQPYGYIIRQNQTIGVLLTFKSRKAYLHFYKGSVSCGQAFEIDIQNLKSQRKNLIPFVTIGGQSQLTLDSKAIQPLDTYRLR